MDISGFKISLFVLDRLLKTLASKLECLVQLKFSPTIKDKLEVNNWCKIVYVLDGPQQCGTSTFSRW